MPCQGMPKPRSQAPGSSRPRCPGSSGRGSPPPPCFSTPGGKCLSQADALGVGGGWSARRGAACRGAPGGAAQAYPPDLPAQQRLHVGIPGGTRRGSMAHPPPVQLPRFLAVDGVLQRARSARTFSISASDRGSEKRAVTASKSWRSWPVEATLSSMFWSTVLSGFSRGSWERPLDSGSRRGGGPRPGSRRPPGDDPEQARLPGPCGPQDPDWAGRRTTGRSPEDLALGRTRSFAHLEDVRLRHGLRILHLAPACWSPESRPEPRTPARPRGAGVRGIRWPQLPERRLRQV